MKGVGSGARSRSGSVSQRNGSADPDPHQVSQIPNTALKQSFILYMRVKLIPRNAFFTNAPHPPLPLEGGAAHAAACDWSCK